MVQAGRIVKGIAGFYYCVCEDNLVYECKAKGIFRKDGVKPLVGDFVNVEVLSEADLLGNISEVLPRENELIRPRVANVDQALIVFALHSPEPNLLMLDKMILEYACQNVPVLLCFNKEDLGAEDEIQRIQQVYAGCGARVFIVSTLTGEGIEELKAALFEKTTTVAGPSGVGKSSIVNSITGDTIMETGSISRKLERGKHTTRHSEIIPIGQSSYIIDTPGFGAFDVSAITCDNLADYYEEFHVDSECRFIPCSHTHEPDCCIKEAVFNGIINRTRYENYVQIYHALKEANKYPR